MKNYLACNELIFNTISGVDPGFLERGFIMWGGSLSGGVHFADFNSFFMIFHENEIIWSH